MWPGNLIFVPGRFLHLPFDSKSQILSFLGRDVTLRPVFLVTFCVKTMILHICAGVKRKDEKYQIFLSRSKPHVLGMVSTVTKGQAILSGQGPEVVSEVERCLSSACWNPSCVSCSKFSTRQIPSLVLSKVEGSAVWLKESNYRTNRLKFAIARLLKSGCGNLVLNYWDCPVTPAKAGRSSQWQAF